MLNDLETAQTDFWEAGGMLINRSQWICLGLKLEQWPLGSFESPVAELLEVTAEQHSLAWAKNARARAMDDSLSPIIPEPMAEKVVAYLLIRSLHFDDLIELLSSGVELGREWELKDHEGETGARRAADAELDLHLRGSFDEAVREVGIDVLADPEFIDNNRLIYEGEGLPLDEAIHYGWEMACVGIYALSSLRYGMLSDGVRVGFSRALFELYGRALDEHKQWRG